MILSPGTVVAERFQVVRDLGAGGMAEVYVVEHLTLGTQHAFKLLTWRNDDLKARLFREGRIQAQLEHPNIVAVTDVIEHDGMVGLLLELVRGGDLESLLDAEGRLPVEAALTLFNSLLSAVGHAHALGITHRDIKPANILLANSTHGPIAKISDFGIAKVAADPGSTTRQGVTMGTPGYLPPEQFRDSAAVDHRADIFALGVLLYEMLTLHLPYNTGDDGVISPVSTLVAPLTPIHDVLPGCPVYVWDALYTALQRDPADRFDSCDAFRQALFLPELALGIAVSEGPIQTSEIPRTITPRQETYAEPAAQDPPDDLAPAAVVAPPVASPGRRFLLVVPLAVLAVVAIAGFSRPWGTAAPTPVPAVVETRAVPVMPVSAEGPVQDPVEAPAPVLQAPVPVPVVEREPVPVVAVVPEPAVVETSVPSLETSVPVVVDVPEPVVVETSVPVVETPDPVMVDGPEPAVVETSVPIVETSVPILETSEPAVVAAPLPVVVDEPDTTSVAGAWSGRLGRNRIGLELQQDGTVLTGTLRVVHLPGRPPHVESVRGTLIGDVVRLDAGTWSFVGRRTNDDRMTGTNGEGARQQAWTLSR